MSSLGEADALSIAMNATPWAVTLFIVSALGWTFLEGGLMMRDRARGQWRGARDRGTRTMVFALTLTAIVAADVLSEATGVRSSLRIDGAGTARWLTAFAVIWLGLAIRVWAVVSLGRAFRTTVQVDTAQDVISHGPYRLIRHPSYTGILLAAAGFGLALDTWPGLALCVVLPLAALVRRIQVEEAELIRVLGDPYRDYIGRTKRLIPGLW